MGPLHDWAARDQVRCSAPLLGPNCSASRQRRPDGPFEPLPMPAASGRPTDPRLYRLSYQPPAPLISSLGPLTSRRREAPQPRRNSRMLLKHSLSHRGSG